jgi:hypothetical protein
MMKLLFIYMVIWGTCFKAQAWSSYGDYSNSFVDLATAKTIKDVDQESAKVATSPVQVSEPVSLSTQQSAPSSEAVSGSAPSEEGLASSPRPRQRPSLETAAKPPEKSQETAKPATTTNLNLYDMRGCKYGKGYSTNEHCYKSMSIPDRANRILWAVDYVNRLHQTKFDARYMLCTGYRESNFNPGARGADGERGMFQVMKATGKAALRYGSKLPEFSKMGSEDYMTRMASSTIAQVELSFLTLEMKLTEDGNKNRKSRIMSGSGTVEDFRYMAGRYNGGGANSVYAKRISNCYSCMRGKIQANTTKVDSSIKTCLDKAK